MSRWTPARPGRRLRLAAVVGLAGSCLALPAQAALPQNVLARGEAQVVDRAADVDPMVGTFAPGFTVPGAATPFGMVQVSPDTGGPVAYSGYSWHDPRIQGFSHVHLSGPGVKKAGDVPLMPTVGQVTSSDPQRYAATYDHATERATPGAYGVRLGNGVQVDVGATTRTGIQRYAFPPAGQANVLLDVARSVEGVHSGSLEVVDADTVRGSARGRYPVFFEADFSRPFTATGTWLGDALTPGGRSVSGDGSGRLGVVRGRQARSRSGSASPSSTPRGPVATSTPRPCPTSPPPRRPPGPPGTPSWPGCRSGAAAARPPHVRHGALPLAAAPQRVQRRRPPLRGHGRRGAHRPGPRPVRELLVLGHLQGAEPAARHGVAGPLPRHAAVPARRRPRERAPAALGRAEPRRLAHERRPRDPDDRRRLLPRACSTA